VVPESIHTPPREGIGISWGVGGSTRQKNLNKCMKLNWNFQRGGEVLEKIPSVGKVWIFSGSTQYTSHSLPLLRVVYQEYFPLHVAISLMTAVH